MNVVVVLFAVSVLTTLASECHRHLPSHGKWYESPPYWEPDNCKTQYFNKDATRRCLRDRTVYVVGSTIARQFAFHTAELLGAPHANRTRQLHICPKHDLSWNGCVQEHQGIKVKYLYLPYIDGFNYTHRGGFPYYINNDERVKIQANSPLDLQPWWQYPTDVCTHANSTLQCLQRFFHGSSSQDVLIFNVGLTYGYNLPNKEIDIFAWLTASATAFKSHLKQVFAGHVFRVTMSQLTRRLSNHSPLLQEVDELLYNLWKPSHGESNPWYNIDQWAINKDRDHMYVDRIHYPGNLSFATLYQVLSVLCPGGGVDGQHVITTGNSLKPLKLSDSVKVGGRSGYKTLLTSSNRTSRLRKPRANNTISLA